MNKLETVEHSDVTSVNPLRKKQNEDVARMRASLLVCSGDAPITAKCINDITLQRVYHQIARIIQYTEMMDKIEDKLYQSIDQTLEVLDTSDLSTLATLLNLQERLQRNMIESHKLLQPYLNIAESGFASALDYIPDEVDNPNTVMLDKSARDNIRVSARRVLELISDSEVNTV